MAFMVIEPKQGKACITPHSVLHSSKAYSPGHFTLTHKPQLTAREETRLHLVPNEENLEEYKFRLELQVRMKAFQSQITTNSS